MVIAKRVWTAFGTTDTFFDGSKCKDSVAYRDDLWSKEELRDRVAMDPMRYWRMYVLGTDGLRDEGSDGDLLSDPWLYFLAMLEWAMAEAQREYTPIISEMQEAVDNGYVGHLLIPFSAALGSNSNGSPFSLTCFRYPADTAEQGQDLEGEWTDEALEHIRRVMTCLGDLLEAWKTFQSEDPRFLDVDVNARYLPNIKRSFNTLDKYHKQLADLKKKLKRSEEKIKQQLHVQVRDGQSYGQTLAILIILFSPLSQVMSLFNMQGLPFALSPVSFAVSLAGIGCMWVVVYWVVMRGIAATTLWGVHARRYLGHATAGTWERVVSFVWRGRLGEVFELEGSRPADGSTPPPQDPPEPGAGAQKSSTWPIFSMRRRNERQHDAGHTV